MSFGGVKSYTKIFDCAWGPGGPCPPPTPALFKGQSYSEMGLRETQCEAKRGYLDTRKLRPHQGFHVVPRVQVGESFWGALFTYIFLHH